MQYSMPPFDVKHHGRLSPSMVVHLSLILPFTVKGKTQLPQAPVLVLVGAEVETVPSLQVADSSPREAKANLLSLMTLALLETPATPVGVPDRGRTTAGFE